MLPARFGPWLSASLPLYVRCGGFFLDMLDTLDFISREGGEFRDRGGGSSG